MGLAGAIVGVQRHPPREGGSRLRGEAAARRPDKRGKLPHELAAEAEAEPAVVKLLRAASPAQGKGREWG